MKLLKDSSDHDSATFCVHENKMKRLLCCQYQSKFNSNIEPATSLDLVQIDQPTSTESREHGAMRAIGDYDDEEFEYESLSYFNLPRPGDGEIVIAVQAATISSLKMNVRKEGTIDNVSLDLDSGIAVVGVVREVGINVDEEMIRVGDRVATLLKSVMKNVRYAKVSATMISQVPFGLDSAEAAAATHTYLLGFQSLTHGIADPSIRYSGCLFNSKNVLITDGASTTGQALIQLTKSLGARKIYATSQESHHELLRSSGAEPLSEQSREWLDRLQGKIHVVVDTVLAENFQFHSIEKVLIREGGKLVFVGCPINFVNLRHGSKDSWRCLYRQVLAQALMCVSSTNATYYDLFSQIDNYPQSLMNDMNHVLHLLGEDRIRPKISKYVNSDELTYGLVSIDPNAIAGSIICEPWKRRGPPSFKWGYTQMVRS